jgi:hypothetical protein
MRARLSPTIHRINAKGAGDATYPEGTASECASRPLELALQGTLSLRVAGHARPCVDDVVGCQPTAVGLIDKTSEDLDYLPLPAAIVAQIQKTC